MDYPAKEMTCTCGNTVTVDRKRVWCTQCGKPVYHDPKAQRLHRLNNFYLTGLIILVLGFLAFIFIEVVAVPIFKIQMPK